MSEVILLASLGIVAFVLAFLFIKLGGDKDSGSSHYVLQILLLGFIMVVFALIGKVAVDNSQDCAWNVANTTVSGSVYTYDTVYQCVDNDSNHNTSQLIFQWMVRFIWIVGIYLFLYLMYSVLTFFGYVGGGKDNE